MAGVILTSTEQTAAASIKCVVIFDRNDGRIRHVHHSVTLPGGVEPSERELGEWTLALAAQRGIERSEVDVLHVANDSIQPHTRYRVDLLKRAIVPIA
jgi:hypothetical protein